MDYGKLVLGIIGLSPLAYLLMTGGWPFYRYWPLCRNKDGSFWGD